MPTPKESPPTPLTRTFSPGLPSSSRVLPSLRGSLEEGREALFAPANGSERFRWGDYE
jgi:hypothetical protein